MLNRMTLSNFRSIRHATVDFSPTGLTVVVGANGSGKSNLVMAIQFLSDIARDGLEEAVHWQRGMDALLPKAYAQGALKRLSCDVETIHTMPRPEWYPSSAPQLRAQHSLSIGRARGGTAIVRRESLGFSEPLLVDYYAEHRQVTRPPSVTAGPSPEDIAGSVLRVSFEGAEDVMVETEPPFEAHSQGFLGWLGLGVFGKDPSFDRSELESILNSLHRGFRHAEHQTRTPDSWISKKAQGPLAFSAEAKTFRSIIADIQRYDFQLPQLRHEQEATSVPRMSSEGRGLPAVIRYLRTQKQMGPMWLRLASTMKAIAPHVFDASVSRLSSGKEFVRFVESKAGRDVESWESSDGTLRALAILAAMEAHPAHSTILLEEPEHGLHPWAVRILMNHIKEVMTVRNLQVIATTHSQQVLDSVLPSEVLVASRTEANGTRFDPVSAFADERGLIDGGLGRMWVSGLLGGVPSYDR